MLIEQSGFARWDRGGSAAADADANGYIRIRAFLRVAAVLIAVVMREVCGAECV